MGNKSNEDGRPKKRHIGKPFQLRLHPLLKEQLRILAERNTTKMTAEIVRAIRELLQRENLWPPPQSSH